MNIEHVKYLNACISDEISDIDQFQDFFTCPETRPTNLQDGTINGFTGIHYATFYNSEHVFDKLVRYQYEFKTAVTTSIQIESFEADRVEGSKTTPRRHEPPPSPGVSPVLVSRSKMQLLLPAGTTPLAIAIATRNRSFFEKIAQFYTLDKQIKVASGEETPLHVAARVSGTAFVFSSCGLLSCLSCPNQDGETPLFVAARHMRYDVIQELQKLITQDRKGVVQALVYTAFCQLCHGKTLVNAAFSIHGNSMFAVACDHLIKLANRFSKTYENYTLETALLNYERATEDVAQNAKLRQQMSRFQGSGSVDWI